jgi:hypothetical protein
VRNLRLVRDYIMSTVMICAFVTFAGLLGMDGTLIGVE